ncbi:unnamed protein product, partial [Urochloa humidicola]
SRGGREQQSAVRALAGVGSPSGTPTSSSGRQSVKARGTATSGGGRPRAQWSGRGPHPTSGCDEHANGHASDLWMD